MPFMSKICQDFLDNSVQLPFFRKTVCVTQLWNSLVVMQLWNSLVVMQLSRRLRPCCCQANGQVPHATNDPAQVRLPGLGSDFLT